MYLVFTRYKKTASRCQRTLRGEGRGAAGSGITASVELQTADPDSIHSGNGGH